MNRPTVASRWNLDVIEEHHKRWQTNPASVDETWRIFFEGYELGLDRDSSTSAVATETGNGSAQAAVTRLIDAYREMGHRLANLDPLGLNPPPESLDGLRLEDFGLSETELDQTFFTKMTSPPTTTLRNILEILRETYCETIGVEYMHIRNAEVRQWLKERMEPHKNHPGLDLKVKRRILLKLNQAELFEVFLHTHYLGAKRFSLEGGESLIPLLDAIVERSSRQGVHELVMGMPHRGRLSVLANILNKPIGSIFSEFEGRMTTETESGDGDVKYHLGYSGHHPTGDGGKVYLTLTPNPSHLEFVNPVVEGRARAKQLRLKDTQRKKVLPLLMHGDAAFAGQGIVTETLNLSQLKGYKTGGTIHVVVNNQVGFTTNPVDARSTRYATDVAKMLEVPIFHVNGDDPEAAVYVAELALDFRQAFGQDVVIDLVCYRKHGHNEGDEPAFTQPVMYEVIRSRPTVREKYTEALIAAGDLSRNEADTIAETLNNKMQSLYDEVHSGGHVAKPNSRRGFAGAWHGFGRKYSFDPVPTGATLDAMKSVVEASLRYPQGFTVNSKVKNLMLARLKAVESGVGVDWGLAETLAFGTLLLEKTPIRLSGQDSRRGTFSHRHSTLVDAKTGQDYVPLNNLAAGQAEFTAYDSLLSEAAVLGFDYGYSLDDPRMLILWEAQFGDFSNGAQVIIDQFICSAESKWGRGSGLVMLLPHGYEGMGPEHSSARLERYLQLCAEDNIQVVNATTPAQFFHLLRRQIKRDFRKPLVVMSPKSLLRAKAAVSTMQELVEGRFHEVIDDSVEADKVKRVLVCSGKIYYDLVNQREKAEKLREVAILRLEQLYPWPVEALKASLTRYRNTREWVWVQEESQNMGAWSFVAPRLQEIVGQPIQYVGRDASASPATGSHAVHDREQAEIVEAAIGLSLPHLITSR